MTDNHPALEAKGLHLYYGDVHALRGIDLEIQRHEITALIGPSGCGKSTFLRCFNRMNDMIDGVQTEGRILVEGTDVHGLNVDLELLRKRVGMVFQKSNPFPKSIYDNVAYGPRIHGLAGNKAEVDEDFITGHFE